MSFGEVLKSVRVAHKQTQQEFAEMCGLTQACISQIEAGIRLPSYTVIWSLYRAGISIDYLLAQDFEGDGHG